jgi:hemerythrin superfamily protein
MNAIEMLKHDHRMVEQLFRDYRAAASDGQRQGVTEVLIRELSKHAAVEETLFYPFAAQVLGDRVVVDRELAGHLTIKQLLVDLDGVGSGDPGQDDLMWLVESAVAEHVRDEEDELMPRLSAAADEQSLAELGQEIDHDKAHAPTRTHPHAPDRPPVLTLAAPVVGIYDRLRDRIEGRPLT